MRLRLSLRDRFRSGADGPPSPSPLDPSSAASPDADADTDTDMDIDGDTDIDADVDVDGDIDVDVDVDGDGRALSVTARDGPLRGGVRTFLYGSGENTPAPVVPCNSKSDSCHPERSRAAAQSKDPPDIRAETKEMFRLRCAPLNMTGLVILSTSEGSPGQNV